MVIDVITVVYTAATVLLAERLRPIDVEPTSSDQKRTSISWERAIKLLRAYSRVGPSAERCVTALGLLAAKIQAVAQRDLPGAITEDEPCASEAEGAPLDEMANVSQLGDSMHSTDFGYLDFDINDMFWLNTSAADIILDPFSSR